MSSEPQEQYSISGEPVLVESKTVAVIDIGTAAIRMVIAEIRGDGEVHKLESLTQDVHLGRDTFTQGVISKGTVEECVRVLKSYRQKLNEYQINSTDQIRVVATSAVREAENRLAFLDRIYVATGLQVEPADEAEISRATYLGIQPYLRSEPALVDATALVIEVGGGSSEVLVVRGGDVFFSHTYKLGSLRLRETLEAYRASSAQLRRIMESQIKRTIDNVAQQVAAHENLEMIALGGDVRFAAGQLLRKWEHNRLGRIAVDSLEKFANRVLDMSVDDLVHRYHRTFPDAETLGPALLAYVQLARRLELDHIYVTNVNLRDGLLMEMVASEGWTEDSSKPVIQSALELGRKYDFDESHARHVAELSKQLFLKLQDEHRLDARYELILYVAALLHEIGMFVNAASHHKHTMYLISNSELFGLPALDLNLVSLVARYHRRPSPKPSHDKYGTLNREQRIAVAKMASILRVADALDSSRSQRIQKFVCQRDDGRLVICIPHAEDLSLEQLALREKGNLFEEIFGVPVLLRKISE